MISDEKKHRFGRQILFSGWGVNGQQKLGAAAVVQVGCGALGSTLAQLMVRAGVGRYAIIDGDAPDLTNLHRQCLFDETDVAAKTNKAEAAGAKLGLADPSVKIKAIPEVLTAANADEFLAGHDLVLDALDNMETRLIINDWCVKHRVPWIYGGVAAASGMSMTIIPGQGPCLRCLFPDPDAAEHAATTQAVGIINAAPVVIAALQATEAQKILIGSQDLVRDFRVLDLWSGDWQSFAVKRNEKCPCCGKGEFIFLEGEE